MAYLQSLLETIFLFFYGAFLSYGGAAICLSIAVTVLLTPFYYLTSILENREARMRERLRFFTDKIGQITNPQLRYKHL